MVLHFLWESMSLPKPHVPDLIRDQTPDSFRGFFLPASPIFMEINIQIIRTGILTFIRKFPYLSQVSQFKINNLFNEYLIRWIGLSKVVMNKHDK